MMSSDGAVKSGLAPELDLRQVQTRVDAARVDVAKLHGTGGPR